MHLKLMIELLQKENDWDVRLQHLWELGSNVPDSYIADTAKVYMAWCSLPHKIQMVIEQPQEATLSKSVNTCCAVPQSTYEWVLANHDQKLTIEKQLHTLQQHYREDCKMCNNLAGIRQFMDTMASTQLLLTPPKDTGQFLPALQQYTQPVTQQAHLPQSPPWDYYAMQQAPQQPCLVKIPQMTFKNTSQGHAQYKAVMEQFA
ncbi:hypothetical protein [Sporisorium scitamineum]|uniref:Uncharacterized protein n=1 Tax=Sporisorium scitamineum TaxID=49012 RepID=A0A0F7S7A4_9BASI|nr:hypothetical protein [Sporisorium scitamineum]